MGIKCKLVDISDRVGDEIRNKKEIEIEVEDYSPSRILINKKSGDKEYWMEKRDLIKIYKSFCKNVELK